MVLLDKLDEGDFDGADRSVLSFNYSLAFVCINFSDFGFALFCYVLIAREYIFEAPMFYQIITFFLFILFVGILRSCLKDERLSPYFFGAYLVSFPFKGDLGIVSFKIDSFSCRCVVCILS